MKIAYKEIIKYLYVFIFIFLFFAKKEYITGTIRVTGTSMFPNVVISAEDRDYYFDKKFFKEYAKYEGQIITVEAKIKKETLWLADKSKSFDKYIILYAKKK
ncbi:hypothetical protein [uncultured Brachyspira sp.]|uniref:hypothetical protein n=1 Tax=uncultured Brachyspira sp. TaxID=221953 RepID=UPI0026375C0C|nr:hypothetical protein [uncultured Brachyspira sp.]